MRLLERMEGPSRDEEEDTDGSAKRQQRFALIPTVYATNIAAIGNTWVDDDPNDDQDATYFADLAASLVPRMRSQGVTPVTETYNALYTRRAICRRPSFHSGRGEACATKYRIRPSARGRPFRGRVAAMPRPRTKFWRPWRRRIMVEQRQPEQGKNRNIAAAEYSVLYYGT